MQKRKRYEGGGRVYCFARKNRMQIAEGAYADIEISENLVQLLVKDDQIRIKGEKEHEVRCNGKRVEEDSLPVSEGDMVEIPGMEITFFSHRIEVKSETDFVCGLLQVHGAQEPSQGFPLYKRAPRIVYQDIREKIEIVPPPEKKTMGKGSLAQLIIPSLTMLAFTIAMSVFLKRGAYVYMSAGMTLITILFSLQKYLAEKKETKRENQKRREVYEQYLLDTRKKINALRREERKILNYREPTIHELERMVHHYSSRIYERSALEEDFLKVNLGYRKGASLVEVSFGEKKLTTEQDELLDMARELSAQYRVISGIPVTVDLKKAHLGLVGSKKNLHEQLKLILAQLTFFQSYHDLQIILIHSKEYEEEFRYARWYPHLRIKRINVIAGISNDQSRDQILGSLQQILKERKTKQEEEKKDSLFLPHLLFIIDEPKMILNHAIMEYLQASGMDLGFSMIYTTNQRESLPENIKSICLVQNVTDGILLLENGLQRNISFQLQSLQEIRLETMARNLSVLLHE
ncbi:MAG: type VII secretion protein EssC, partial [Lachnospiraceae bacterium]